VGVRVGVVVLPEQSWRVAREVWQRVEELGFAHGWTYDHLSWRSFHDSPWYGAVPVLAAAASVTERIRLGTLVASPNFRHPVSFAREVVTLDDLSGGRFILGFGSGGTGFDATALGNKAWSARERGERFREFVLLLDRLLVGKALTEGGDHYRAHDARAYGGTQQPRVPFYLAATGPKGMRLVAEVAQGWVTHDTDLPDQVERFRAACAEVGSEPAVRLIVADSRQGRPLESVEAFRDAQGRYAELGFTDMVVHYPRATDPYRARESVLDDLAAAGLLGN
jgi:alkanesulfonate monooxygenase SsuD/methylene tetrahydromethanopterin reductase-like flavin-dependent oxidoreductase (luciferase family)